MIFMQTFNFPTKNKKTILALGAESAGNFSVHFPISPLSKRRVDEETVYFSPDFGDLLDEDNFNNFKESVLSFLKKEKIKPDIILTDLHPLMRTTLWGQKLAKKFRAQHIQIQHHRAHIFSAIGDNLIKNLKYPKTVDCEPGTIYGIAMDGTGHGANERIWGGEVFRLRTVDRELRTIRIGHLENQILLGGELAIREPARMLISILDKFLNKKDVYNFVKKYYSKNEFEILYNQLKQNFNCLETSSTGRILDAVSLLFGFCSNQRKYKHEAIDLLEKNSTKPYTIPKPKIKKISTNYYELQTTNLFKYLIKNLHKDKKRLGTTAQLYLAQGLYEIIKKNYELQTKDCPLPAVFAAGGVTNNKIISKYLTSKNIYLNNNIPRGDAGLSFGQLIWFLLKK